MVSLVQRIFAFQFFKKDFIYLLLERNINVREIYQSAASHMPPPRDLAHNSGMCPDWELNQRPLDSQAGTQSTEPHQTGLHFKFDNCCQRFSPPSLYQYTFLSTVFERASHLSQILSISLFAFI